MYVYHILAVIEILIFTASFNLHSNASNKGYEEHKTYNNLNS